MTKRQGIYTQPRKDLANWVRCQLVGPPNEGDVAVMQALPTERFPCGALYPASPWGDGLDAGMDERGDDVAVVVESETDGVESPSVPRYVPPSSVGFSFFISGDVVALQVLAFACIYEPRDRGLDGRFIHAWYRRRLCGAEGDPAHIQWRSSDSASATQQFELLRDANGAGCARARVDVRRRRHRDGWVVTVTLCNVQDLPDSDSKYARERCERTLFEAKLRCVIEQGHVGDYPRVDRSLLDEEEQEIEIQYANRRIYAVGHGAAVDWQTDETGTVKEIWSDPMPAVEVPQVTADTGSDGDLVLSLLHLSSFRDQPEFATQLASFVDGYADWVKGQQALARELEPEDQQAGHRIVARMATALERMRAGIRVLQRDPKAAVAFSLANRGMLDQMRQRDRTQGSPKPDGHYRWRPFQLAFFLTVLESAANEDSDFRDTVDLIWFPTGGGKTEAYLGLIAFLVVLRRLRHPDSGGGTTALMRYTLRLLTRDQFLRGARLICALELIRRQHAELGQDPITIGLWVGGAASPNSFEDALKRCTEAASRGHLPSLVVDACPWCGSPFDQGSFVATRNDFYFSCQRQGCDLSTPQHDRLPCNVVDEALFAHPPTLLIATLDKFARLAWDERASAFFGCERHRPPELIVQDELHLVAGALGSIAGLYEAGIDTVIQLRGVHPKLIASTATIRMAKQQVRRLYGRELAVFPPPGLSCDDAYFARTVNTEKRPGRLYIGYLAPLLNRQKCFAPLAAALLAAPESLFARQEDADALLDAWWTQVVYHGSLKGVGNSATAFESDVREFLGLLSPSGATVNRSQARIEQLTSRQTADENAQVFAQLREGRGSPHCLDGVLATNMVSVGLDVARLALMAINGQPLTTAEYIQASSRVGRGDVPGLVFMNYYRDQARSLSHYESFRPYHEAFYRFVEPTSVTPFTYQAKLRALHAALVIVIRHSRLGLLNNSEAGRFDSEASRVREAIARLTLRCRQADPDSAGVIGDRLALLVLHWQEEVTRCVVSRRLLEYQVKDQDSGRDRLLYNFDDRIAGLWRTLQSMRSVEHTGLLKTL